MNVDPTGPFCWLNLCGPDRVPEPDRGACLLYLLLFALVGGGVAISCVIGPGLALLFRGW